MNNRSEKKTDSGGAIKNFVCQLPGGLVSEKSFRKNKILGDSSTNFLRLGRSFDRAIQEFSRNSSQAQQKTKFEDEISDCDISFLTKFL